MKKKVTLSLISLSLLGAAYWGVPKYAQSHAEKKLAHLGYAKAVIDKTNVSFTNATFKNITLKKDHTIKRMIVNGSPLSFIGFGDMKSVEVYGLSINGDTRTLIRNIQETKGEFLKKNLPAKKITIKESFAHIPFASQNIPISISGQLIQKNDTNKTTLNGKLTSSNKALNFDTSLEGHFDSKGNGSINITIETLNLNQKLSSIHRATGWLNITQNINNAPKLSGQIDAESGEILSLPAKNINIVLGDENKSYAFILRAQAADIDNVNLLTDISYGGSSSDLNIQSTLDIKDAHAFTAYLESLKVKPKNMFSFKNIGSTKITTRYLPERRFVDGPLPFDITADNNKTNILNGTFLIYPTDMEIRGNAQTNSKYTKDIQTLLSIPDEKVSNDTLRLDGSLSNLF